MCGVSSTLSSASSGIVRRQRLVGEHVQRRPAEVPVAQRLEQRAVVEDRGSRGVDQERARAAWPRNSAAPIRISVAARVQRDHVGGREQLVEPDELDVRGSRPGSMNGSCAITRMSSARAFAATRAAGPPEAEQAERQRPQLGPAEHAVGHGAAGSAGRQITSLRAAHPRRRAAPSARRCAADGACAPMCRTSAMIWPITKSATDSALRPGV